MGILHNAMLVKLDDIRNNRVDLSQVNADPDLKKIILSEEFNASYQAILDATIASQELSGSVNPEEYVVEGIRLSGMAAKVYKLFLEAYNQFPENESDAGMLINRYISIIESAAEFTDDEKEQIYAGLVVAANSPLYWNEKLYERK